MSKPEKKLFLLDAMALIYRAHFAFSKNPRINSKGMSTGAILGFTNSLLEILNKEKPTHIAICFDTPAPTFRHVQYDAYKANREAQPEDIQIAIPWVKKMAEAYRIPILELDGFEADDIVGTFATKAGHQGFEVFMMTPDKDYAQLVQEHVYLYKPAFLGNSVEILGIPEVLAKFDIDRVDQVRDLLGLQGDSVDNIPGIPGVGAKTASKLLKEFGTVENLIANTDKLKGKLQENVIQFAQQGIMSKELATIHCEVPIEFNEEQLRYDGPDEEKLKGIFNELEFRTLAKRIFGEPKKQESGSQMDLFGTPPPVPSNESFEAEQPAEKKTAFTEVHDYHLIDTPELRKSLLKYLLLQKEVCFDTETTNIDSFEAELVGISFAYVVGEAYYIPVPEKFEDAKKIAEEFREVFESESITKIGQNIKYDMTVLKKYGVEVAGPLFDTMLAHYLVDPDTRHNMDVLAENYLNYSPISIETLIGKKGVKQGTMRDADLAAIKEYAAEDADITLQLKEKLEPEVEKYGMKKLLDEVEGPLVKVLSYMEYEGVKIDTDALSQMSGELEKASKVVEKEIYEIAGETFNIASPKQLGEILFDKLKLIESPKKTKTGQYATGEDILSKLANEHPIANKILEFREYQKLKSTYVDALPLMISKIDGRVHTDYRQAVAATGRLSSNNPNLQNIPIRTEKGREIRKAFIPREAGYKIFSADYSQIELRIIAAFAKDESMIEAFKNGRDIHSTTAAKIFKKPLEEVDSDMRRIAKSANFGIIYGISAFGLAENLGISRTESKEIIDAYFTEFPAVKRYMDHIVNVAREQEYVTTILGRRRYLRDINSRNITIRGFAERNAINAPIQGSAADIIKIAMIRIHDWLIKEKMKTKMIMQVHDELVFDVHESELDVVKEKVVHFMENAISLEVPLEVGTGVGNNWLEAH
ncbi:MULTISPECIES: DNA polymerase I [unclassified Imperialibacter]|uniref:DNA polymerase I n=1 Tax=unclassified Imperialibacter TaxID=2629706 RepID=UPI0012590DA8|nr:MULTISPECIES: DNA polymerase I [unclassified Imperialibacter]CAD5269662.1 DNA polymerase I [Imperialibacter sp. 89]CAD5297737.1 DNA polymerase I [Imperialibacter sp. 75]VVT34180.1 DNA polymerase I [Imperialibacter sp. EC-SDR9]